MSTPEDVQDQTARFFVATNEEAVEMTVAEALAQEGQRHGSVGTDESAGI